MKKKVVLEFDDEPTLIFIQRKPGNDFELYQDGKRLKGIRTVDISADYESATTHRIEYLTGMTGETHG